MLPDFNREVHCILGLPFDNISLSDAAQHIRHAAINRTPCFLSTPNLNFLIACQSNAAFRNSVINSDLSIADGMPIIWIARMLGIPIRERVAGSDLFDQLRVRSPKRLSVYFFGGMKGVAETACQRLNTETSGIQCSGFETPGFGAVEEMSSPASIAKINASGADFLLVSLGAQKGQAWIEQNRSHISVPVISHLGAVINFVAGNILRAPVWARKLGLEWLWRIKEEPGLWRRYFADGVMFLKLLLTRVIPYAWFMYWHSPKNKEPDSATIEVLYNENEVTIRLRGVWMQKNLKPLRESFANPLLAGKNVQLDLEQVTYVDNAFIGLLLLFGDRQRMGKQLAVINLQNNVRKIFRYSCAEYVLDWHY